MISYRRCRLIGLYYRIDKKGRLVLCLKRIFLLFWIVLGLFMLQNYYLWGMWDSGQYLVEHECTEEIYVFEGGSFIWGVHTDKQLQAKCLAMQSENQNEIKRRIATLEQSLQISPPVYTKCGQIQPILLNRKVPRPSNNPGNNLVPNVVHYISFGKWKFRFLNYLSFLSASKFIRPNYIYIHGDIQHHGHWWNRTLEDIPNIYHVPRKKPTRSQGKIIRWVEHSTDIIRLQTILDNGGIYLDTDILVVKSFEPLRKYEVTLGRETWYGLGSGIIIAQPLSAFICTWLQGFRDYRPFLWNWAAYAVWIPNKLQKVLPDHIHVEEDTLQRPNWDEIDLLFREHIDWSNKYAIHVFKRDATVPDLVDIIHPHSTVEHVMHYIFYGKKITPNITNVKLTKRNTVMTST